MFHHLEHWRRRWVNCQRKAFVIASNPTAKNINYIFSGTSIAMITLMATDVSAQVIQLPANTSQLVSGVHNDGRICEAVGRVLQLLEGSFGALIMVCAGVAAIISAAFGGYRAAVSLLVVALGSFILRSLVGMWFNGCSGGGAGAGAFAHPG